MIARALICFAAGMLLSACVDSERLRNNLGGPELEFGNQADPSKQTMSSKVLGALALERITRRKPDPARLIELR